ncbi:MAG TPA: hypothetical protein VEH27_02285 [Methylomirabilota bacterium]|nr:hypothetical protein [Methylomirabilota bacterium]
MANERKDEAIREVERMRERIARERADLKNLRERFRQAFDKPPAAPSLNSDTTPSKPHP